MGSEARCSAVLWVKATGKKSGPGKQETSSSSVCQKGLGKGWVTTAAQEMGSSGQLEIQEGKQICRSIRKVDKASLRPQTQLAVWSCVSVLNFRVLGCWNAFWVTGVPAGKHSSPLTAVIDGEIKIEMCFGNIKITTEISLLLLSVLLVRAVWNYKALSFHAKMSVGIPEGRLSLGKGIRVWILLNDSFISCFI